jgi:hypothetical protein
MLGTPFLGKAVHKPSVKPFCAFCGFRSPPSAVQSLKLAPRVTLAGRPLRPPCPLVPRWSSMSSPRPRQKRPTRTAAEDGEDISPDPTPEDLEDTEDAAAITRLRPVGRRDIPKESSCQTGAGTAQSAPFFGQTRRQDCLLDVFTGKSACVTFVRVLYVLRITFYAGAGITVPVCVLSAAFVAGCG